MFCHAKPLILYVHHTGGLQALPDASSALKQANILSMVFQNNQDQQAALADSGTQDDFAAAGSADIGNPHTSDLSAFLSGEHMRRNSLNGVISCIQTIVRLCILLLVSHTVLAMVCLQHFQGLHRSHTSHLHLPQGCDPSMG